MPMFPNGLGQPLGDILAMNAPLHASGNVWYVLSTIGDDASASGGLDDNSPLATLRQAYLNAADDDIICLLSGHTETLGTLLVIEKRLCIVGAGSNNGRPTVKLTHALETGTLQIAADDVEVRNIWFEEAYGLTANTIFVSGDRFRMIGCYLEAGEFNNYPVLRISGDAARIVDSTFISIATARDAQPSKAISMDAGGVIELLELDGLVLSGGAYGWSDPYVFEVESETAITLLKAQNVSLLLGADMRISATTTGWINIATATGGAHVVWAV